MKKGERIDAFFWITTPVLPNNNNCLWSLTFNFYPNNNISSLLGKPAELLIMSIYVHLVLNG